MKRGVPLVDHKTRVLNAIQFKAVDRPPFDLFDESGFLFTEGRYDPAKRIGLTIEQQIYARIQFHKEFDTDLIFDAPVLGQTKSSFQAHLLPDHSAQYELKSAFFPLTACLWIPWSPNVIPKPGHSLDETDNIGYAIEWDNGLKLQLFLETASGNISGYDKLMKNREEWGLWRQVFMPSFERFDYSLIDKILRETKGDVALYGTVCCPFSMVAVLLGLEKAITLFFDDLEFAQELMRFFSDTVIEVGKDLIRHEVDILRIGGAWTSLLGPQMYEQFVLPYHRMIAGALREAGGFTILHCCGHVNKMLESYAKGSWDGLEPLTPPPLGDVVLEEAKHRVGDKTCLKGNLDPVHVLKEGGADCVARATRECLAIGSRNGGYILSVADCMAPGTPKAHMEIVVDIVHRY